jgi:FAD-dependent oxidoreductase domain-containing protein 1
MLRQSLQRRYSTNSRSFDVVVVGGGVMGSSTAFWLKHFDPKLEIAVIERDPTYRQASTSLSVGSFRQQFSRPENIQLSMYSSHFFANHLSSMLAVDGDVPPNISLVYGGYLLLASQGEGEANMRENYAIQKKFNAKVALHEPESLANNFSWLNTKGIALGSHGFANEGWFDPHALLAVFKRKAQSMGATYLHASASKMKLDSNKVHTVCLEDGTELKCASVVNAGGPWAAAVSAMAGVANYPVRPRKRFVFQFHSPSAPKSTLPLTVDPSGVYFRSDGPPQHFLCGRSPSEAEDVDWEGGELTVEEGFFETSIWPTLAERVPAFEQLKVRSSWAGLYEYNTFDQNGILGPHPTISNLYFANGFSGHGVQQSPAVGRVIAERMLYGEYRTIDVSQFGFERILENTPRPERCIV